MSKPSYVTYVIDRLDGFGGESHPVETYADLDDFPVLHRKVFGDPGRSRRRLPACDGPITRPRSRGGHAWTSSTSRPRCPRARRRS